MVALQIRGVSEEVRDALAAQAAVRGQSLQRYLLEVVVGHAHRAGNPAVLARFAGRSDGVRTRPGETVAELEAARSDDP